MALQQSPTSSPRGQRRSSATAAPAPWLRCLPARAARPCRSRWRATPLRSPPGRGWLRQPTDEFPQPGRRQPVVQRRHWHAGARSGEHQHRHHRRAGADVGHVLSAELGDHPGTAVGEIAEPACGQLLTAPRDCRAILVCGDRHLQQQRNAQCRPLESSADIYIILSKSGPGRGAAAPRKGGADCAMTATESAERALFASTAAEFLDKEASLRTVRELHAADQSFEPGWWRRATELGWTSLLVSDDLGGGSVSGNGVADLALIAELAGRTVAPGPLHPVNIVLARLVDANNRADHAAHIGALMAGGGEAVASWAVYEPDRPFDPLAPPLTATATSTGYRLSGVKDRVEAAAESALLLVVARLAGEAHQFVVHTRAGRV